MKTKLAQFVYLFNQIDRQYIQLAYCAFILLAVLVMPCPSDGGTGPIR